MDIFSVTSVTDSYQVILLDAFGVFWGGDKKGFYSGALETFKTLKRQGKIIAIISNATALMQKEQKKYADAGLFLGVHYDSLLTSGQFAHDCWMRDEVPFQCDHRPVKYYVLGDNHPVYGSPHRALFEDASCYFVGDPKQADFIYIGIPHVSGQDQPDLSVLQNSVRELLPLGKPMVCASPDAVAIEGDPPRSVVRQGSIAKLYEQLGGKVYYYGKPDAAIFTTVLKQLQNKIAPNARALMIGDNPETDVAGGRAAGLDTALITGTGVIADQYERLGHAAFLAQLPPWQKPTHCIRYFRDPPLGQTICPSFPSFPS